jgi:hypothetical protein
MMLTKVIGGVAVAAALTAAVLGWQLKIALEAKGKLAGQVVQLKGDLDGANKDIEKLRNDAKAIAEINKEGDELKALLRSDLALRREWHEQLKADDEDVNDWSAELLPAAVIERLWSKRSGSEETTDSDTAASELTDADSKT